MGVLERLGSILGCLVEFRAVLGNLEPSWGCLGNILGVWEASWGRLGGVLEPS